MELFETFVIPKKDQDRIKRLYNNIVKAKIAFESATEMLRDTHADLWGAVHEKWPDMKHKKLVYNVEDNTITCTGFDWEKRRLERELAEVKELKKKSTLLKRLKKDTTK